MPKQTRYQKLKEMGLCPMCSGERDRHTVLCSKCYQKNREIRKRPHIAANEVEARKKWYRKNKLNFLDSLGGKCICCGCNNPDMLTLDHINGNGCEHRRKENASGVNLYRKIKLEGDLTNYQIMCYNCNIMKYRIGKCDPSYHTFSKD